MASLGASSLAGPVPFKDVDVANDDHHVSLPDEYTDVISTMPSTTMLGVLLRNYRGSWLIHDRVRGALAVERRFAPRPGDVILASPPKCGTTWLKALSFAIMARAVYPPSSTEHPLLRLNPHDCVPFMDILFTVGQEAKLQALPSPRLMRTHMHHSLLPASVTENPDCKIVYVCRGGEPELTTTQSGGAGPRRASCRARTGDYAEARARRHRQYYGFLVCSCLYKHQQHIDRKMLGQTNSRRSVQAKENMEVPE